jgi:diguanylate cyclase (GGDEF)-like protein/PAS domain S-box-containing protein
MGFALQSIHISLLLHLTAENRIHSAETVALLPFGRFPVGPLVGGLSLNSLFTKAENISMMKKRSQTGEVQLSDEYYKKVLDNLYDGIYFIDRDLRIIYWNQGAEKLTGYNQSEVMFRHCYDLLMHTNEGGEKLCDGMCPVTGTITDGRLKEVDVYFHHREGHLVRASMRIAPIRDLNEQIVVAVEIYNENSPRFALHRQVEELKRLTLYDSLTELGNRAFIESTLKGRLEEMERYGWKFGLLFIDIDHFKEINDRFGHDTGDRVLKTVSRTMANSLRSFDIVGRWGGEEFVAIVVNVDEEKLYSVANRLRVLVQQSGIPTEAGIVRATVSIGGTLAQDGDTIETIIRRADQSMYNSKRNGRNCVSIDMNCLRFTKALTAP